MLCVSPGPFAALSILARKVNKRGRFIIRRIKLFISGRFSKKVCNVFLLHGKLINVYDII